jgi:hypothetical protein
MLAFVVAGVRLRSNAVDDGDSELHEYPSLVARRAA